jgi:hypothetical protein
MESHQTGRILGIGAADVFSHHGCRQGGRITGAIDNFRGWRQVKYPRGFPGKGNGLLRQIDRRQLAMERQLFDFGRRGLRRHGRRSCENKAQKGDNERRIGRQFRRFNNLYRISFRVSRNLSKFRTTGDA